MKTNRAQSDCIYRWVDVRENKLSNYEKVEAFIEEFNSIDPQYDKYVVRVSGGLNGPDTVVNGLRHKTRESAAKEIHDFIISILKGKVFTLLSYNSELEEVKYSGAEDGVIYKRWVGELE